MAAETSHLGACVCGAVTAPGTRPLRGLLLGSGVVETIV